MRLGFGRGWRVLYYEGGASIEMNRRQAWAYAEMFGGHVITNETGLLAFDECLRASKGRKS